MTHFNILVLDAAQRSALAVVRSLGQHSELQVFTAEADTRALAGQSTYSKEFFTCPSSSHQPQVFVQWLADTQRKLCFDLVIPVTEITSQLILFNASQLAHVPIPFPHYECVMQLANKSHLVKLAESIGVACPKSIHYSCSEELDLQQITFPCVIKPFLSRLYNNNQWISTSVGIIYSMSNLQGYLNKNPYLTYSGFMLQEYIPGQGAGIFCLFEKGNPVIFFAHKRIREKPPQGGVSVLSESQAVDPHLQTVAQKLLTAAHWHGVAMVEFRIDENGKAYLMEINTRFWGSLQLSIDAGVDFPWLLVAQTLGLPHQIPEHYQYGRRLRWLLGDVDSLYLYFKSKASFGAKLKRLISFLTPDFFHTRHEINRLSDFKPALHEFKRYLLRK